MEIKYNKYLGYDGHAHPHLCDKQEPFTVQAKFGIMSVCKKDPLQELLDGRLDVPKNYGLAVGCHPRDGRVNAAKEDDVLVKIQELFDAKKLFAVGEVGKLILPFFPCIEYHSFLVLFSIHSL